MLPSSFFSAKEILNRLEQKGHRAYFVGGSVRDHLIGRPIGDIDITTSALPEEVMSIFPKVIPVGIEHGTVIVRHEEESFEVTTFRTETGYSDYRHPDQVHFVDQVEADLSRRDFTMNAIAMDISGNLIDPYQGEEDIKACRIRTVGNAGERFREDPLRMMRAIRFCSQLGFAIETNTWNELCHHVALMREISIERIAKELEKLFQGPDVAQGWQHIQQTALFRHFPILDNTDQLVSTLVHIVRPLATFGEIISLFYLLNPDVAIPAWVKEWKLSNQVKKEATILAEAITYSRANGIDPWLVYQLPPALFVNFVRLCRILLPDKDVSVETLESVWQQLAIKGQQDLAVNGKDLINLFPAKKKGPWIGTLQQEIEKRVVFGCLPNDEKKIKEWAQQWNPPATS